MTRCTALGVPVRPALTLRAIVTSWPALDRIVIDASRKAIDPSATPPEPVGVAGIALSAEHGTIRLRAAGDEPRVGDRVCLNIGYSDQAVHLHEQLVVVRGEQVVAVWPMLARRRLT